MCHPNRINRINQKAVFQTIFQPQFFQVAILVPARVCCRHHNFKTTKPNCVKYTCRICDSISSAKSHPIPTFFLRPFKAICVITFHRWFDVEKKNTHRRFRRRYESFNDSRWFSTTSTPKNKQSVKAKNRWFFVVLKTGPLFWFAHRMG